MSRLCDFKSQGSLYRYKSWKTRHVWETTVFRICIPRAMAYIRRFFIIRCNIQYCAKEMQTKFAEISEITRISAIKLRTFASDEKAAKFRCFYCSNVGEISQARWLIETKFRGMRPNFVAKFRARWTKFRVVRTKFRFDEARFRFDETKYRLDETKFCFHETKFRLSKNFVADYRITVIITSCKSTGTCKRDHYCKKKHRNNCYNCGDVLRQNGAFWLVTFFYFFLNIILF